MSKLLEFVGSIIIPAARQQFVVKDHFIESGQRNSSVRISSLTEEFKRLFIDEVESPLISVTTLECHCARKFWLKDRRIIKELGGEEKNIRVSLAEIYALLKRQKRCGRGTLLNNGKWNIFFAESTGSNLCIVKVRSTKRGWLIGAECLGSELVWGNGDYVFSRPLE